MVLSGLLGSSNDRAVAFPGSALLASAKRNDTADAGLPKHISEEEQLGPLEEETPDLRELNESLEALAAVFPNIQMDVFRELLTNFDGESRLAVVTETLLRNRVAYVKGRWRVPTPLDGLGSNMRPRRTQGNAIVPQKQIFHSPQYIKAVKRLAWHEFKGMSKSTINAVLAESNHSYLDARRTLAELSSKSWRFAISSVFRRKRAATSDEAEDHPLILWKSTGQGTRLPCLKATGNAELDRELFNELILPIRERSRLSQEAADHRLANAINAQEAEALHSMHECVCCFADSAFEDFTSCNDQGHMVCFRCVQRSIKEALFGQSWQRSIDKDTGTLRCPAVDSNECRGYIPSDHMHRAMLVQEKGAEIMHKLEQRLAEYSLVATGLPLVRCPFCSYAEVDDIYLPKHKARLQVRVNNVYKLLSVILCIGMLPFILPVLLISSTVAVLLSSRQPIGDSVASQFRDAIARLRRRQRGLKFECQAAECGRTSCLNCSKEWVDVHVCHESALVALRTRVEQAMSMAIKRVCPRCNTSFVKTAGCNKLTCPCGYKMCYVCRKDIGGHDDGPDVGYRHFCDHFRPEGEGRPCGQCHKCNLWESENTDEVLQQAKEEVERKWREAEKRELSGPERTYLETGVAAQSKSDGVGRVFSGKQWPSWAEVCDKVVENLLV